MTYDFQEKGAMLYHKGPHGEVTLLVRRQRKGWAICWVFLGKEWVRLGKCAEQV